jgi:hypothetical protein
MTTITYTLTLRSDAEIGTGLGGELVNDLVSRDHRGKPIIPATHIKGLVRDHIQSIATLRGADDLADYCLGKEGTSEGGWALFSDAKAPDGAETLHITRTALTELGSIKDGSLRTTEAVKAGTVFAGSVRISDALDAEARTIATTVIRLALLSLDAVGGGRTRGGGACYVDLDTDESPGALLKSLAGIVSSGLPPVARSWTAPTVTTPLSAGRPVILRLIYEADSPICCPELPVSENNVIRTGLAIPASAVQGAIISRLAAIDPSLAQATFEDDRTRAWPLLPCADEGEDVSKLPVPVRVDLSHRMSKLPDEAGNHAFKDAALKPYDWRKVAKGSPLKGADGVILRNGSEENNMLWRSGDMARVLSSHARHYEERNLFTVESLAPMIFSGWISLPQSAADALCASLKKDPVIPFGKARTIRGSGRLHAEPADWHTLFADWRTDVLVLQSPVALPDQGLRSDDRQVLAQSAESLLAAMVEQAGWGPVNKKPRQQHEILVQTQAACGVRFGWNRHGLGNVVGEARLRGRRVFLPGSVVVLEHEKTGDELIDLLLRGLGDGGREQGFGAVLPHPCMAKHLRKLDGDIPSMKQSSPAGFWAFEWFAKSGRGNGPSPSQISAVAERIDADSAKRAMEYLEKQKKERPPRVWAKWEDVHEDVLEKLSGEPAVAKQALRTWQDLVVANRSNDKDKGEQ